MQCSRDISAHLDVYADLDSISTSTRDMWMSLIKRWVRDYSWKRYRDDVAPEPKSDRLEDTGMLVEKEGEGEGKREGDICEV